MQMNAAYHSPDNFVEPLSFLPERWLPDGGDRFSKDNKDVFEPFSAGPRNCIGQRYVSTSRLVTEAFSFYTYLGQNPIPFSSLPLQYSTARICLNDSVF